MESDPRDEFYEHKLRRAEGQPGFNRASSELVLGLARLYSLIEGEMTRSIMPLGISLSAYNLLDILEHQEDHCAPLFEIGKLLLVSRANVTGLMDNLAKRGLVQRVRHPTDRRCVLARLLPAGEELLRTQKPIHQKVIRELTACLSEEEKHQLIGMMKHWKAGIASSEVYAS